MEHEIFKKFSDNLKKALIEAEKLSADQSKALDTEHQLMSLSLQKNTLASEILIGFNITPDKIGLTSSLLDTNSKIKQEGIVSADAKKSIERAVKIASQYGHTQVDCEHLLLAILEDENFNSFNIVNRLGVKPSLIQNQIRSLFGAIRDIKATHLNDTNDDIESQEIESFEIPRQIPPLNFGNKEKKESLLNIYAKNITSVAKSKGLDPVIGRDNEIDRMIQVLSRRTKNNPILIGEPGVGKTSIVEGLAKRLVDGKVPVNLLNHEIFSLDMGSLIAGTMYRGQFENRIKKVLAEVIKRKNAILFIDEIHTVVGAGSTEGSIDAANILKPLLTKGNLSLIGSTTFDDYKKYIEKDPAFERRLQPVKVEEPSVESSIKILRGIKKKYESHHHVAYSDEALISAVELSKRYLNDRFLPDKAIDLIDEAAAATKKSTKEIEKLTALKRSHAILINKKDALMRSEKFDAAAKLLDKEKELTAKIKRLEIAINKSDIISIDERDIAKIVSKWTGIPVSDLTDKEKLQYLNLNNRIKRKIIGQDQAIDEIVRAIKRSRVGLSNPNRPIGSFIFLGPTGVGKTLLAKTIATELLHDANALIKIDMSEFMERHNVSRLIGAPAGYVGYEEGGKLTEAVRKNPHSIILFDEIEKAHPEAFNILLQIMEDGELTDSKGRKVSFKNAIIIMTSNLGTDILTRQAAIGFSSNSSADDNYTKLEKSVLESVEKSFKPEFINRIDKIIVFHPLSKSSIKSIVTLELENIKSRLLNNKLRIKFLPEVRDLIAEKSFDPNFGARPVRRTISELIETPVSENILSDIFCPGDSIIASVEADSIIFKKDHSKNKK